LSEATLAAKSDRESISAAQKKKTGIDSAPLLKQRDTIKLQVKIEQPS